VSTPMLRPMGQALSRRVARFGRVVERLLIAHREAVLEKQYIQERVADAAVALMTSACTLSRWDRSELLGRSTPSERSAAELYLRMANRRFDESVRTLHSNDDRLTTEAADAALRVWRDRPATR
jgi:acyl-CoA dehydrogenase family protein 9